MLQVRNRRNSCKKSKKNENMAFYQNPELLIDNDGQQTIRNCIMNGLEWKDKDDQFLSCFLCC